MFHVERAFWFHVERRKMCVSRGTLDLVSRETVKKARFTWNIVRSNAQVIRMRMSFECAGHSNETGVRMRMPFECARCSNADVVRKVKCVRRLSDSGMALNWKF
jgi:hypothetical protein